jgi:hypothetical protein
MQIVSNVLTKEIGPKDFFHEYQYNTKFAILALKYENFGK